MYKFCGIIYPLFFIISHVYCEGQLFKRMEMVSTDIDPQDLDMDFDEKLIERFEEVALLAEKNRRRDTTHYGVNGELYDEMNLIIDEMIAVLRNYNNTHKFLKAKGIERVVLNNLKIDNDNYKTRLLILLKALFDVDPVTTNAVIPLSIVDRLLHIFEHDNLALKAHALDVLYLWLPNNPRVQSRVMKLKGLKPFYEQISKLDTNVIKMLLDLFNKILKEHIIARSEGKKYLLDSETLKFYQRTGLLEHMDSPMVCNGLLNIFASMWSYNTKDNNILMTVFELLKNIKQYCAKMFRGKIKAQNLFNALHNYVLKPENKENFMLHGMNVTDITMVIEDYIEKLKYSIKDEF